MRPAVGFLAKSGFAAGTAALLIMSVGVGNTSAQSRPAASPCDSLNAVPAIGPAVGGAVCTVVNAIIPAGGLPALPVPLPGLPGVPAAGGSSTPTTAAAAAPASPVPGLPALPIPDLASQLAPLAAGPAILLGLLTSLPKPTILNLSPTITACGNSIVALGGSADGSCSIATAAVSDPNALINVPLNALVCGNAVAAGSGTAKAGCSGTSGITGGASTGGLLGNLVNVPINVTACGNGISLLGGTASAACTITAPPTNNSVPATNSSVPPKTLAPTTPPATNSSVPAGASPVPSAGPATNASVPTRAVSAPPAGGGRTTGGGGSLPITGVSLTFLVLAAAAVLHWGIIARLIAARRLRRPMA